MPYINKYTTWILFIKNNLIINFFFKLRLQAFGLGIGRQLNKNTKILPLGFLRIIWVLFFNSNYLFSCRDNRI